MMASMIENEKRIIGIMEHCVLNADFCDDCENNKEDYVGCRKTHEDFFVTIKDALAQRNALLADLHAVCAGKFVDICCICGHYQPDKEGELKCELNGLICSWVWRGVQKKENEKDVQP